MLAVGDPAPDFSLPSDTDGEVSLSDLRGQHVVLYFYPRDSTPGCTAQACEYTEQQAAFAEKNAVIFGVSKDSLDSHGRFRAKYELGIPLLSDPDLAVHKAYGAYGEKMMYGKKKMGVIRTTVVIGADGNIAHYKRNVRAKGNAARTLALL